MGHVLLVLHKSFEYSSVHRNVIKPCQSLHIEGGWLRHYGLEVVGGITIKGGSYEGSLLRVEAIGGIATWGRGCYQTRRINLFGLLFLPPLRHLCGRLPGGGKHEEFPVSCPFPGYYCRKNPTCMLFCCRLGLWL